MAFAPWIASLSDRQREVLHDACVITMDWCFDDLEAISKQETDRVEIEDTLFFGSALPGVFDHHYNVSFLRSFALTVATVGWKLAQTEPQQLSNVAEELALRALFIEAQGLMELRELPVESFGDARQEVAEDLDVDCLFDPKLDGVGEGEIAAQMGMASMAFADWFKPFASGSRGRPHPYTTDD